MTERKSQTILCLALLLAASGATAEETACDGPANPFDIPDIDADVIFFGELHGNRETPEAFLAAICQYLELQGGDVRVALEFHTDIYASLERFMESEGDSEAVQEFLRHPVWQRGLNLPDGRTSVAMLNLFEALRELRVSTTRLVSVTPIMGHWTDRQIRYFGTASDAIMAANITHLSQESDDDVVFVLVGNIHARLAPPESMNYLTPAASLVEGDVASVLVLPESGDSWNCQSACQSWPVGEVTDLSAWESRIRTEGSYDYVLPIGRVSSSPPAVSETRESRRINNFARFVDGGSQIRVAELVIFDHVDRTSQCFAQRVDEAEELFERRQIAIGIELDKEIGIAGFRIEVHAARR